MDSQASSASLRLVPSPKSARKKPAKKPPAVATPVLSRGRRSMFLRIPTETYDKLQRMTAARFAAGERDGVGGTIIKLIESAKEKS